MSKKYSDMVWVPEEIDVIGKLGNILSDAELHALLSNHTKIAIGSKRRRLGVKIGNNKWTEEEMQVLRKHANCPLEELVKLFPHRTKNALSKKILKSGMRSKLKTALQWQSQEDELLLKNGMNLSSVELSGLLQNRNPSAIAARCFKLGIRKNKSCRVRLATSAQQAMNLDALRKLDQRIVLEDLDNTTRQVLMGSMLGDGCITKSKNSAAYHFYEGHGPNQRDYVLWKKDHFSIFEPTAYKNTITTPVHAIFTKLRGAFYHSSGGDKQFIPIEIIDQLDLLGLMIWYLDDGYLGRPKSGLKHNGKFRRTNPHIICKGYDMCDLNNACDSLNKHYDLSLCVKKSRHKGGLNKCISINGDKNYIFPIWQKAALQLHLPLCMHYKLNMHNGTLWENESTREHSGV